MANRKKGETLWNKVLQVMVSEKTKAELKELAVQQGLSQSALARLLLEEGVQARSLQVTR
jgi:DNA-binding Xre family transcriptional regulator